MTREPYRLEFHAAASEKTRGLPTAAYTALVDTLVAVLRDPWGTTEVDIPHPPEFRWTVFGEQGLVAVHVDESRRVVRVYEIIWAG